LGGQFDFKDARRRWQLVIELNKLKVSSFDAQGLVAFAEWRWLSFHIGMAPKYHPTPVSGSHRKALAKGLTRTRDDIDSRAARGRNARRRRSDDPRSGRPALPELERTHVGRWRARRSSPTVDQSINGGYPWLEIACSRCRTPRTVDLASLPHVPTTFVHDLAGRLRCEKCRNAGKRPPAELRQLAKRPRHDPDAMP
jgi:hypothetical protein